MIDRKMRHPPEVRGREMELVHEGHCEDEKAAVAYKASEGRRPGRPIEKVKVKVKVSTLHTRLSHKRQHRSGTSQDHLPVLAVE